MFTSNLEREERVKTSCCRATCGAVQWRERGERKEDED
jgi:hypothetical protein